MLQTFRAITNSFIGKVFFTILLGTFALLGVGYGMRDLLLEATSSNDAATINGAKITLRALDVEYHRQLQNYQQQSGGKFNPTQQQKLALAHDTFEQQITNMLYAQQADRAGFLISDELVRDVIESEPSFAGMDKRFDKARFHMQLESQGLSEASFVPVIRAGLARQLVINPVANSGQAPRSLAEDIYRYRNEKRVAETIMIPNATATGITPPTDAEIEAFYRKHPVEFTAPEYRSFTVLSVSPDLFVGEINPTDDKLREAYDAGKSDYVAPEKRKVTQALLNDKATADAVMQAIKSGKPLADAVKTATNGKSQALALDLLAKAEFPEGLREPVFAAAKDAIVGPIQTLLGWHVVQVSEIQAGHEIPFDQVKAKLAEQAKHDGAASLLADRIDKLGDKLFGGASMEDVAAGINATPVKFGAFDAKGNPLASPGAGTAPDAVKPDPAWLAEAFKLQPKDSSTFDDDKKGGYFAVRLDGVTAPAVRPLAEVRPLIVATLTKERQAAQSAKRADALAAKMKAGATMAQVATEAGLKVETAPPVVRDPGAAKIGNLLPPPVVDALFQLSKVGEVTTVEADDGQLVARLAEIREADPKTAGNDLDKLQHELDSAMQSDTIAQYRNVLRDSAKMKINPRAAELVAGQ